MAKSKNKLFSSEESRFQLLIGAKVTSVPFAVALVIVFLFFILIKMDQIFFEATGLFVPTEGELPFTSYIYNEISVYFIYIIGLFASLFLAGTFLGALLIRPFKVLADYCDAAIINEEESYDPDMFSDLKLLTRFSDFFFGCAYKARKDGQLSPTKIPEMYTRIHGPVFDRIFFIHFLLFLCILTIVVSTIINIFAVEIHQSIVELAITHIKDSGQIVSYYLNHQSEVLDLVMIFSILTIILSYLILSFHLYATVSGAAFGIFATMRTFLKGNYDARVHLIGYPHIRPYSRAINRYLDFMQKKYQQKKNIGK